MLKMLKKLEILKDWEKMEAAVGFNMVVLTS